MFASLIGCMSMFSPRNRDSGTLSAKVDRPGLVLVMIIIIIIIIIIIMMRIIIVVSPKMWVDPCTRSLGEEQLQLALIRQVMP